MTYLWVLITAFVLAGCGKPGIEAMVLGGNDVEQAIALSDQYDIKHCSHVKGSAGFWSITGNGESYTAMGKGVSMMDCFRFFNPGITVPPSTTTFSAPTRSAPVMAPARDREPETLP